MAIYVLAYVRSRVRIADSDIVLYVKDSINVQGEGSLVCGAAIACACRGLLFASTLVRAGRLSEKTSG